jgi:Domain of unknown function (DUF4476)
MKTIFTLLASLILSAAVIAAGPYPKSVLTIKSVDRGSIRVIIDGRRFEPNDNYMRIQGMEAGYHNVKIYRERNNGFYTIFGHQYEVVFNNSISLRPRTNVMISVDRFGRTTVNESRANGWYGRDDRGYNGRDDRGFGSQNDKSFDNSDDRNWDANHDFNYDRSGNQSDYNKDRDVKFGDRGQNNNDGRFGDKGDRGYNDNSNMGNNDNSYNRAMNDFEFNRVLASINKEWIETNKTKSATQIINTNYFTASQVKQMLQLFSFENTKLDLAKQAYSKTVDQKNYFMVNDVLSFSSKDELARYIRSFR